MSDAETMAYNIEYGETFGTGCVDFNENTWRNWFYLWVNKIYWGCEYMYIKEIHDNKEKIEISTRILKSLPNWFGIPESTQEYISESSNFPFFAAIDESNPLGFISIKENNQYTAEIYVMGVLPNYHKQGIGKALFKMILQWSKENGYEYLQVKTLDKSHPDLYYAGTRKFYLSIGFKPLECLPELWGKENPCLIMIRHID